MLNFDPSVAQHYPKGEDSHNFKSTLPEYSSAPGGMVPKKKIFKNNSNLFNNS